MWYHYVFVGLILLGVIGRVVVTELRRYRQNRQPEYTETAKVTDKRWLDDAYGKRFLVTFETETGTVAELQTERMLYIRLEIGQTGILTWQADRCWDFKI